MKSTTSTGPATTTTEYTHSLGNYTTHVWNIRSSAAADVIADFYRYENMSSVNAGEFGHTRLEKSFPRHRALVMASLGSSRELIVRDMCRKRYNTVAATSAASARAHDTRRATPFTDLSVYQKHHLVSMSGLAGLLVSRWTGVRGAQSHTIKSTKTHAELTAKYIHSALACEFLVGVRYYRDLPRYVAALSLYSGSSDRNVVGSDKTSIMAHFTPADVSPESVAATKTELLETYAAQIVRLVGMVRQYKRGFVDIQAIRTDPEFTRMMCAFWRYSNQLMKLKNDFEHGINAQLRLGECSSIIDARRFFVVADICAAIVLTPQLYNYDIVHLLDNTSQSYAKYVKSAKNTSLRLSNDGLTAAFLSFSAIEPRMLTAEMAPKHGMKYQTTTMSSCANHIPSRDPLLGALRVLHRQHIPRTADAVTADIQGIPRSHHSTLNDCRYSPLHDTVENIRTGGRRDTTPMITSAAKAYAARQVAAAAAEAAAEAAAGWILCSRRKRK